MTADDTSGIGSHPVTQPNRREPTRKATSRSTVTSQRQLIARLRRCRGNCQIVPYARASARDRLVAETSTTKVPATPNAPTPPPRNAWSRICREASGRSARSATSVVAPRPTSAPSRINVGKIEVKACAAIVMDRSNICTRTSPDVVATVIRAGHLAMA
jgi:hypothetical protein